MIKSALFMLMLALCASAFAQRRENDSRKDMYDYEIKALYIYNISKLTQWPDGVVSSSGISICIVNQDDVYHSLLDRVSSLSGHQEIKLVYVDQLGKLERCDVIFVGQYRGDVARRLSVLFRGKPKLLITDDLRVEREGVMIYMYNINDRMAFDIYVKNLQNSNLSVSSKLLRLADRVIE
jgi:hypothetical protein